jgi:hypothetical protein
MEAKARSGRRPSAGLVVAMTALVAALAGTAIAADPPTRAITKSKVKKIAVKQINKLAPDLSVASATTAGSAGTAGRADTAGRAENVLWAVVVDDDGAGNAALVRAGQAGTTATEVTDGVVVDFAQPVTECAWIATKGAISDTTPGLPGGEATTEGVSGNPSGVKVEVRTSSGGSFLDDPFHLLVVC